MAVGRGKDTGSEHDVLDRLERATDRLACLLADGVDEEIAVLVALTVRTLQRVAEHDLAGRHDDRFAELRERGAPLLARAPERLHGAGAVLRLLRRTRRS